MKPQRSRVSAYALIRDANRILLCRLSKELPRWEGFWTLPGGGLNFGEHPEDTVVREVEEETGFLVKVRSIATVDSIHDTSGSEDFHGIRIIYHVDVVGGHLRHETSGSTDRCEWHRLHPAPEIPLGDLAQVGIRLAQTTWSSSLDNISSQIELLRAAYAAFNARDIDAAVLLMTPDVAWPRAFKGGFVRGPDEIRAYWTEQWSEVDPNVEPLAFQAEDDGRILVKVHQVVRDLAGTILADERVGHRFTMEHGLIRDMEVCSLPSADGFIEAKAKT